MSGVNSPTHFHEEPFLFTAAGKEQRRSSYFVQIPPLPLKSLKEMKVLQFGRFHNSNFGGLERHVELLQVELHRHIHVDNIVSNDKFRDELEKVNGSNIYKIASLGLLAGTAMTPAMPQRVRALWRANRYDIMHLHFPDPLSHFSVGFLPRRTKIVISWHSDVIRQKRFLRFYKPFLDRIVRRADAIIAATPMHFTTSTQLSACGDLGKLHVIPYGIDFDRFAMTPELSKSVSRIRERYDGKKLVFSVGRHVYYKGYEYLLRSMADVDATLLLGGTGPLTDGLKRLVGSLHLKDKVVFLGRVPDDELPSYYHASEVFCLPSVERSEAFGIVQVEAMACRKPVVCCELHNGVSYVNQHGITGLVVPPRDPRSLAAALNELLGDEQKRKAMGEAGYARVRREFTLERMCRDTLCLYQSVLNGKSA